MRFILKSPGFRRWLSGFCLAVLMSSTFVSERVRGQESRNADDDWTFRLLQRTLKDRNLVGVACCVIKNGKIVTSGAAGVRKSGSPERLQVSDPLHLGSCTKAMTATLVGRLVEQDRLKWQTRLVDVYPALRKTIHPDYHSVTVLDLLTHQAGVPKNNVDGWPSGKPIRSLRLELIRRSLKPKPEQEVGRYYYSNLGYITIGSILEKLTHRTWEDLIRERLFKPLKMESAGFGPPGLRNFQNSDARERKLNSKTVDHALGHVLDEDRNWKPILYDNPPILGPAGTVHCSILDWAKFVAVHTSWVHRQPKLLKKETLQFLQQPRSDARNACGWFVYQRAWGDGPVLHHLGSNTFWMANVWASPRKDFAILVVTNCCRDEIAQDLDSIIRALLDRYL